MLYESSQEHYESYAYHRRNCCRRDLIDDAFSVFAEASLTGAGATFPARCMPNGLTLTRKKPVIKLTTGYRFFRWRKTDYR